MPNGTTHSARKGLGAEEAERLSLHPLYFADSLVRNEEVAGCVAGCVYTTADVLRAALWLIGPAPGVKTVSSAFYMAVSAFRGGGEEVLTFTDCAVVPYPTSEQLADIAIAAGRDRARIVGDAAQVALLSFSTHGSASGDSVELVRRALTIVRAKAPALAVDGELQADAALLPAVAMRKAPSSGVAGRANVLVFPSLDSGNIAYKLVERIAGASADDIINVAAITALQAGPADAP